MLARTLMSAAAVLVAAASAAPAAVSVSVTFNPVAAMFAPDWGAPYGMFMSINATGFTSDGNPNNFVKIESFRDATTNPMFGASAHPGVDGGSGSPLFSTIGELNTALNDTRPWTLTITDGVTNVTRTYTVRVSTPGISAGYLPLIVMNYGNGAHIPATPTVAWTEATPTGPNSAFNAAEASFYGADNGNYFNQPPITPASRMWTPSATLPADNHYTLQVNNNNDNPPQTLVVATAPAPNAGAPALASFTQHVKLTTFAQSGDIVVEGAPVCGSADFNGDGDVGTDQDIEAFFRVLAGGNC